MNGHRRSVLALLAVLAISSIACGFLEKNADVTYDTEFDFEIPINADELCQQAGDIDCSKQTTESPMTINLGDIEHDQNIDIVEQTGRTELREASSRFKEITITSVDYEAMSNSLSFDTPEIELHMGPKAATERGDSGVFKLTTLPPISAGKNESGTAPVSSSAESKASDLFKKLKLTAIGRGKPKVKKGQDLPPNGKATVKITMKVRFVANPVDAAKK